MIQSLATDLRTLLSTLIIMSCGLSVGQIFAQGTRIMDHDDFLLWKKIENSEISNSGRYIQYQVSPGEGDSEVLLYDQQQKNTIQIHRGKKSAFDHEGSYLFLMVSPPRDSLRHWERKKIDKKKWPSDTLCIHTLSTGSQVRIGNVTNYSFPKKASDWISYELKPSAVKSDSSKFHKKADKDLFHLIIRQLSTGWEDTVKFVSGYNWAEDINSVLIIQGEVDSIQTSSVLLWSNKSKTPLIQKKGKYDKPSLFSEGNQLAFLGHQDTTKSPSTPWKLYYAKSPDYKLQTLTGPDTSFLPLVSQEAKPMFSDNGRYLFYGRCEKPLIRDTSWLEDEYVDVEVWTSFDPVLYTVQNKSLDKIKKANFTYAWNLASNKPVKVSHSLKDRLIYSDKRNSRYVLQVNEESYQLMETWESDTPVDVALVDLETGKRTEIISNTISKVDISPAGNFVYGYTYTDSCWWAYHIESKKMIKTLKNSSMKFYDEEHDLPSMPGDYGIAGWTAEDKVILLYDKFDIWLWEPLKSNTPMRITKGREKNHVHRMIDLDPEEEALTSDEWLVRVTDDKSKDQALIWISGNTFEQTSANFQPYKFSSRFQKAKNGQTVLFQKENFNTFPNLEITNDKFATTSIISDVNPQQQEYSWGTIELYRWIDFENVERTGMLVKPADFDTLKSYPTIINFYEKSSDDLHNYPHPAPGRSTINYAFYASRGYVIFNPDITYSVGYPGESAYKAVVSGATSLFKKRIADPNHTGLQGHSWGGYQIAYIIARTDIFTCAEAGAPVVNMTSAYGGIRWESGRSRMFQYEKTQSRIGHTLWQSPNLYLENSPLFRVDKVKTPVLILHNDEDGAVPFEQGVEYYMALRRLGKPAWLLNYRGEPHWPVKWQNRKDFQKRLSQYFDHYLKGEPMPKWMKEGVPALARTIDDGLETD